MPRGRKVHISATVTRKELKLQKEQQTLHEITATVSQYASPYTKGEIMGDEDVRGCKKINKIWSLMSCPTTIEAIHIAMYLSLYI